MVYICNKIPQANFTQHNCLVERELFENTLPGCLFPLRRDHWLPNFFFTINEHFRMKRLLLSLLFIAGIFSATRLQAQCAYGSPSVISTVAAPTTVGATITSPTMNDNQVYRVTGIVAGNVYRVYNCGSGFDTQITIFPSGGGTSEGYNDDNGPECSGAAASINYAPTVSGTKDIKLQRYNCSTAGNSNGTITVRLVSTPSGCTNTSQYPSSAFAAPAAGAGAYTITTCNYQSEYNQMTGAVAGNTFTSTASLSGTYITVRSGTYNGTVVAVGTTPLNWTASAGGTYFIHYNTNSSCGTASTCMSTTITNTSPAALPGENCANAQNLASLTSPYSATTVGYANDISTCRTGYPDRIFYISVPAGSTVDIWQSINNYDSYHYMGYGSTCPGTQIYCVDDSDTQNNPWTNTTGSTQTVWFIVDGYNGSGTFTLNWTISAPYNPCTTIPNITNCGVTTNATIASGTGAYDPPSTTCGYSTPGKEQIYTFTAPYTGSYQIAQTSSFTYTDYFFKAASGGCSATGWTCIADLNGAATSVSSSFNLTAGTQYYILLDPESTTGGNVSFSIVCPPPPANDNCANAIDIASLPYTSAIISNNTATDDVPSSACDGPYKNIWWKVTGICGTMTAITCTGGTNFDNEMAVFTGSCGSMTQVVCNDDNGAGCTSNYAGVSWTATAGTVYYISVGSYYTSGATGNLQLNVTATPFALPSITSATAGASSVCPGSTTTLTANGVGGDGAVVTWWTGPGGTGSNLGTGTSLPNAGPGTYYARVTGTCSPAVEASVSVGTLAAPSITNVTAGSSSLCPGATTTLTANGVGGDGATVTWWTGPGGTGSNLGTGTSLPNMGAGTYYARVTGTCSPAQEASTSITPLIAPSITSVTAGTNPVCGSSTTTLNAVGVGGSGATVTWWSGPGGTGTNLGTGNSLPNAGAGTYYARVTGDCSPADEASLEITSLPEVNYYADSDGDSYGAGSATPACVQPPNTVSNNTDCNDAVAAINPGAQEICNGGTDDDCDGDADDADNSVIGQGTYYADNDGDTYGSGSPVLACLQGALSASSTDCNDAVFAINPGAQEICNGGTDDDCDGDADDADNSVSGQGTYYTDNDGDTYGSGSPVLACLQGALSASSTDCNDAVFAINPGAQEICNGGTDDDCDGDADDADNSVIGQGTYYNDNDGDGFGAGAMIHTCVQGSLSAFGNDCDDASLGINPDAQEICNGGTDDDCDGDADDADNSVIGQSTYYADNDGDSFGAGAALLHCVQPLNTSSNSTDCDDTNDEIFPGADESCNDTDDDCDTSIDEGLPNSSWYQDADGDLRGNPDVSVIDCAQPAGYVAEPTDCDDTEWKRCPNPTYMPTPTTNITNTSATLHWTVSPCAVGFVVEYRMITVPPTPVWSIITINNTTTPYDLTGLQEGKSYQWRVKNICFDTITTNSGYAAPIQIFNTLYRVYPDGDGDGFGESGSSHIFVSTFPYAGYALTNTDCDDENATAYPGAPELCNGIDDNCDLQIETNTTWYQDLDGDGRGNPNVSQVACVQPPGYVANNTDCADNSPALCPKPYNMTTTNITDVSATVSWSPLPCATKYRLEYRRTNPNDPSWTVVTPYPTSPTHTLTGLMPGGGKTYQWRVAAICTPGGTGPESGYLSLQNFATWYKVYTDADGDGYGDSAASPSYVASLPQPGFSVNNTDCNDAVATAYPGATEACNGIDDDCDNITDEGGIWYQDADGDGLGNSAVTQMACAQPVGYVANSVDCNDSNPLALCSSPTNVMTASIGATFATITWTASPCANGYNLMYRLNNPSATFSPSYTTSNTTYTFSGLTPGTNYQFRIRAKCPSPNPATTSPWAYYTFSTILPMGLEDGTVEEVSLTPVVLDFDVYPNPTEGVFQIRILSEQDEDAEITVMDGIGKMVFESRRAMVEGLTTEQIDLSHLPGGVYQVSLHQGDMIRSKKIVILR